MTAHVTYWSDVLSTRTGQSKPTSWRAVFDRLEHAIGQTFRGDRTHPGWSAAHFEPAERALCNVVSVSALVLDYDGTHEIEDALEMWSGCFGVLHTTRRHTDDVHRFRAVLPYSRDVTPEEHRELWEYVVRCSHHRVDEACKDASRFWYLPGALPGHPVRFERLEGEPLPVEELLASARELGEAQRSVTRLPVSHASDRLGRYVIRAVEAETERVASAPEGQRNVELNKAAFAVGQLVGAGQLSEEAASNALAEAARQCGLPAWEARRTIASGLRAGQRQPRQLPASVLDPVPSLGGREAYRPVPAAVPGYVNGSGTAQHTEDGLVTLEEAPDTLPATPSPSPIEWRGTSDIFAPLPPIEWVSKGLQLCAGRPAILAGYGSSAKTLSAQALALAVASGTLAWGRYDTARMRVRHLDYEQGWRATARRYQRLAIGHGIDPVRLEGRLEVAVFPSVYLDSPEAVDAYSRACEGTGLVILDALRGAAPRSDENDSSIRAVLDNLSRVSERTGAMFLVLHHAGKTKDGHSDSRQRLRGSSAIFDAAGCVFLLSAGATPNDPRKLEQVKPPAEAEGQAMDAAELVVEDVLYDGDPHAGVRVVARDPEPEDERVASAAAASLVRDSERLLAVVRSSPGMVSGRAIAEAGLGRTRGFQMVEMLEAEGSLRVECVERGAKRLWLRVEGR